MGIKFDFLSKIKIEPNHNKKLRVKSKIIGFRGVRDGLGTTTLLNHVALSMATKNLTVCVLDLDFAMPNSALSSDNVYSILAKLNRQQENIMNIINPTPYASISYVGPSLRETLLDYLPMLLDEAYLNSRNQTMSVLFEELTKKFDVLLVDIPSDIRIPEAVFAMNYCDVVYTLCKINQSYLGKLQRDSAILSSMGDTSSEVNIINIYEQIEGKEIYKSASKDFNLVTDIAHSSEIAMISFNGKIRHIRKPESCESIEEMMYYTGIRAILDDIRGEEADD